MSVRADRLDELVPWLAGWKARSDPYEDYYGVPEQLTGDARLHERWSIGVGGHLAPDDGALAGGLRREFHEELVADWDPAARLLGLLNDDITPVGRVHVGVVYVADAAGRAVTVREANKLSGAFVSPEAVRAGYDHLERWSQLLFDTVEGPSHD